MPDARKSDQARGGVWARLRAHSASCASAMNRIVMPTRIGIKAKTEVSASSEFAIQTLTTKSAPATANRLAIHRGVGLAKAPLMAFCSCAQHAAGAFAHLGDDLG